MSTSKIIELISTDGVSFNVDEVVAMKSETLKKLIEEGSVKNGIHLPDISSDILTKVIEYCKRHVEFGALKKPSSEKLRLGDPKSFDSEFLKVDIDTLHDLILAANYLNIKSLLDLTCKAVADIIKGKSPEELRRTFNIENDFTPEEREHIRQEKALEFLSDSEI